MRETLEGTSICLLRYSKLLMKKMRELLFYPRQRQTKMTMKEWTLPPYKRKEKEEIRRILRNIQVKDEYDLQINNDF